MGDQSGRPYSNLELGIERDIVASIDARRVDLGVDCNLLDVGYLSIQDTCELGQMT